MEPKQKKILFFTFLYWSFFTLALITWGMLYSYQGAHAPHYYYTDIQLDHQGKRLACFRTDSNHNNSSQLILVNPETQAIDILQNYPDENIPSLIDWTEDQSGLILHQANEGWSVLDLKHNELHPITLPQPEPDILSHHQGSIFFRGTLNPETEVSNIYQWQWPSTQIELLEIGQFLPPATEIISLIPHPKEPYIAVILKYPYLDSPYQLSFFDPIREEWNSNPIHSDVPIGLSWSYQSNEIIVTYVHGEHAFLSVFDSIDDPNYTTYQAGAIQKTITPYSLEDGNIYLTQGEYLLAFDRENKTAKGLEYGEQFTERPHLKLFPPSSWALVNNDYDEFEQVELYNIQTQEVRYPFPISPQKAILQNRWFKVANMIRYALTGKIVSIKSHQ